jgi:hypothetical protein
MTRAEAIKLDDALIEKANRLHHTTRTLRAYLDDPEVIEHWGVAHFVNAHLDRISHANVDMHGVVRNALSKRRIDSRS